MSFPHVPPQPQRRKKSRLQTFLITIGVLFGLCMFGSVISAIADPDTKPASTTSSSPSPRNLIEPRPSVSPTTAAPSPTPAPSLTPSRTPTRTATSRPSPTRTRTTSSTTTVRRNVWPGSFCTPSGAIGYTSKGTKMICRTSATDSRLRWRAA